MEALVFDKASGVLKHEKNRKVPVLINDNDIIVKVEYSGLCGTDLHIIEVSFTFKHLNLKNECAPTRSYENYQISK